MSAVKIPIYLEHSGLLIPAHKKDFSEIKRFKS